MMGEFVMVMATEDAVCCNTSAMLDEYTLTHSINHTCPSGMYSTT